MKNTLIIAVAFLLLLSCSSEEKKAQKALMNQVTLAGDKVVAVSFESLSGHLKAAASEGGIENAIDYCNINALPLTDSLSRSFDVDIKRTSAQLRNPANSPDSLEAYMLDLYQQILKMKKPMVGKALLTKNNEVRYFAPIMVKAQCLNCHGTVGQQVSDSTYSLIQARYPADAATGYNEGQLRGLWSINFGDYESVKTMIQELNKESEKVDS